MKHILPLKALKSLYVALIQSCLQYYITAWGNSNHVKKLLLIQKRAMRIINNKNYRHHTDPHFKANQILKITDLYKYHVLSFMYDFTDHFLPGSFERYIVVYTGNKYTITTRHHHHHILTTNLAACVCLCVCAQNFTNFCPTLLFRLQTSRKFCSHSKIPIRCLWTAFCVPLFLIFYEKQ